MNIGIGSFCLEENATRNPQLFLKFTFFVDGVGEGMEKAGSLFVGLPLSIEKGCNDTTIFISSTVNCVHVGGYL